MKLAFSICKKLIKHFNKTVTNEIINKIIIILAHALHTRIIVCTIAILVGRPADLHVITASINSTN